VGKSGFQHQKKYQTVINLSGNLFVTYDLLKKTIILTLSNSFEESNLFV